MSAPLDPAPLTFDTPDDPAAPDDARPAPAGVTALDRLASLGEVVLCSGLPTQFFVTAILYLSGLSPLRPGGGLSMPFVVVLSLADTVLLVGLVLALLHLRGEAPARVFLGHRPVRREAVLGLVLVPVVFGAAAGLGWLVEHHAAWLRNVPDNPLAGLMRTPLDYVIVGVVAVVAGGVREELQRAFVLHRFDQHLGGGGVGLIVFSALFGAGHFVQGYDVMIITGLLGMAWGAVYLRRRSVVAPLLCHALFNLVEIAAFGAAQ